MGTVQKIKSMSESGELKITADYWQDDNQIGYFWYAVTYIDSDGTEIYTHDPSLEGAINSVYASLQAYVTKINIGNEYLFNRR